MVKRFVLLSAAASLLAGLPCFASADHQSLAVAAGASDARRLPRNVVPVSYQIEIAPDLKAATFAGQENIVITVAPGGADHIFLNSRDLKIDASASSLTSDLVGPVALDMKELPQDAMIEITPARHLDAGNYKLHIAFNGTLNDKLVGFYRSTFKDGEGHEHTLAATQMEPTDARRMFPCFDEPDFKASFQMTVKAPPGTVALTNAPLERETVESGGSKIFHFAPTPRMSSYLVALVVGDLEATEPVEVEHVPMRVWSVAGKGKLGQFARDEAAKILPVLSGYFGIPYAWRKLDLIAIPDFEAGAMENPGAITFRETLLLIDPATASSHAKRAASSVIAHEMSHLWFGDLVTMKWWDDLWLNEAFATWSATRAVDKVHPEWQEWKSYASDRVHSMSTDSLMSTRPIHFSVTNPEQAQEMFDVITYDKGCSILRMLERYVSEPKFQQGVHDYLVKHSFANATTADLWDAIGTASGAAVSGIMHPWVSQPGYPLLSLSGSADKGFEVTQHRFLENGSTAADSSIWSVPVGLRTVSKPVSQNEQTPPDQRALIATAKSTLPAVGAENEAVCANAGGVGYYRVKYPADVYEKLVAAAETNLDPSERLSLLDDTWKLVQAGELNINSYLQVITKFKSEHDELVANRIIEQLDYLDAYVNPEQRPAFERFVQDQLSSLYNSLGWVPKADESQQTRMLRAAVLSTLGTIGNDQTVIGKARELFAGLAASKPGSSGGIDPDLVYPVSAIVAYNGNQKDFAFFKQRYEHAVTPEEEKRNLMVLASFKPKDLVSQVEDMSINGSVRSQDAPGLLSTLLSRRDTNWQAWDFVENHWQRITQFYPEQMVPHLVSSASSFNTEPDVERARRFLATHRIPSGESAVARAIERMEINLRFRKSAAPTFNAWLRQKFGNA